MDGSELAGMRFSGIGHALAVSLGSVAAAAKDREGRRVVMATKSGGYGSFKMTTSVATDCVFCGSRVPAKVRHACERGEDGKWRPIVDVQAVKQADSAKAGKS